MKRVYLPLLLILLAFDAKSQNLLGLNKAQIKKYMASRQGVLKNEYSDDTRLVRREPFTEMYYSIPDSIASKDDIHAMSFFLSKDGKCYQYLTEYSNEKSLKTLIEGFDSPNSGLKRVDKSFRWVNMSKGYEIEIIPWKMSHGKWPVIYVLDIHLRK